MLSGQLFLQGEPIRARFFIADDLRGDVFFLEVGCKSVASELCLLMPIFASIADDNSLDENYDLVVR